MQMFLRLEDLKTTLPGHHLSSVCILISPSVSDLFAFSTEYFGTPPDFQILEKESYYLHFD